MLEMCSHLYLNWTTFALVYQMDCTITIIRRLSFVVYNYITKKKANILANVILRCQANSHYSAPCDVLYLA